MLCKNQLNIIFSLCSARNWLKKKKTTISPYCLQNKIGLLLPVLWITWDCFLSAHLSLSKIVRKSYLGCPETATSTVALKRLVWFSFNALSLLWCKLAQNSLRQSKHVGLLYIVNRTFLLSTSKTSERLSLFLITFWYYHCKEKKKIRLGAKYSSSVRHFPTSTENMRKLVLQRTILGLSLISLIVQNAQTFTPHSSNKHFFNMVPDQAIICN